MPESLETVVVRFKGDESITNAVNKSKKAISRLESKLSSFDKKTTSAGKSLSLKLTAPLVLLAGVATKTAIEFESAFTGVRKTVDATEAEFAALRKGFMDMAKEVPIATTTLFEIGEAAGQLGIEKENILEFTRVMADLGATTNLSATEAATSLARFTNIMGTEQDAFKNLGSTIVELGNNLATTEAEIVGMSLRLAGAGKTIGLTEAQVLSLAGALSSVGVQAEAGGTAFSKVMKEIDKAIGSGSAEMAEFARVSGKSVEEFESAWKDDAALALVDFIEGLSRVQAEGENVNRVLDALGLANIRTSDSLLRAAGAGDLFRRSLELGNTAWEENTALTKEAELRYGTTASQLTIAKNKLDSMAASFGEIVAPAILKVIDLLEPLIGWLESLSPTTKTVIVIIAALAAALGPLLIGIGMISSGLAVLTAISSPLLVTIGLIVAAVALLGFAAFQLIENWEAVKTFFEGLWIQFRDIGVKLIMGMVDGVKSAVRWLVDAAVSAVSAAINAAKSVLGISSPSTVFANFGEQMMLGMAEGIKNLAFAPQLAIAAAIPAPASISTSTTDHRSFDQSVRQDITMFISGENPYQQAQALQEIMQLQGRPR